MKTIFGRSLFLEIQRISVFFLFGLMLVAFGGIEQVVTAQLAAGLEALVEPGDLEFIADGFEGLEGPVWHPADYLLFCGEIAETIFKWTPDGEVETFRTSIGRSTGLAFDRQGRLIVCGNSNRIISRIEQDGTIVTLANEYEGKRLNSPNDAVVKSDGSIYFTDPTFGISAPFGIPDTQELEFQGVYRISPDGKTLELLVDDIDTPNGLAFSPDEKVLYIADTLGTNAVYAFDVQPDGTLANRRLFAEIAGYPNGIKVDINGNLYATTYRPLLQFFDSTGKHLGDIVIPDVETSNLAFGGPDNKTLFIICATSVYRIQLKVQGIPALVEPGNITAVTPAGKLVSTWGSLKNR